MDIGVLMVFIVCALALAVALDLSGATVRMVGGMFHAPDLGWPSGVQEDDDMHWSWTPVTTVVPGGPRRQRVAEPELEPQLEEVDSRSLRLELHPIRRGSH